MGACRERQLAGWETGEVGIRSTGDRAWKLGGIVGGQKVGPGGGWGGSGVPGKIGIVEALGEH